MQIMVNKAQVKIQQTAFMLIAVTLFFVLVGLFVLVFALSGIQESANELKEKNALLLVTKLANSPEFSCEESFGRNKINCVDADKAMVLRENAKDYEDFWGPGVTGIEIRKIYPKEKEKLCSMENYPDCNAIRVLSENITGFGMDNFVSLCRKAYDDEGAYDKCEVAKLMVYYDEFQ